MRFSIIAAFFSPVLLVNAANHLVTVGPGGTLTFSSCTQANVNDTVVYTFQGTHTVTQSTFANPCTPLAGGFDSGVLGAGDTYTVLVTSTQPVWIFSGIPGECEKGMVTAINAASTGPQSFDNFLAKAEAVKASTITNSYTTTSGKPSGTGTGNPVGGGAGGVSTTINIETSELTTVTTTLTTGTGGKASTVTTTLTTEIVLNTSASSTTTPIATTVTSTGSKFTTTTTSSSTSSGSSGSKASTTTSGASSATSSSAARPERLASSSAVVVAAIVGLFGALMGAAAM